MGSMLSLRLPFLLVSPALALGGCGPLGGLQPDDEAPLVDDSNDQLHNFSWVVQGRLAGMALPGSQRSLDEDLASLEELGIRLVISLTEDPLPEKQLDEHGMQLMHLPIEDYTPPSQEQLLLFVHRVRGSMGKRQPVVVHCHAGQGRTGTVLAGFLVSQGLSGKEAIAEIRRLRPGSIETDEQEQAVLDFESTWAQARVAG